MTPVRRLRPIAVGLACAAGLAAIAALPAAAAENDPVVRAMNDELARSMKSLALEDLPKPYFISYTVDDYEILNVAASLGSLLRSNEFETRMLNTSVRVGSYDLDESNFNSRSFRFGRSGVSRGSGARERLPIDDDYGEIRRQIWLATDGVYKQSVEKLSQKKAALKSRSVTDELPDFTKREASRHREEPRSVSVDRAAAEALVIEVSRALRDLPAIHDSEVVLDVRTTRSRFVDSEGTSYDTSRPLIIFMARASTQATDGMMLHDFEAAYGRGMDDLPATAELVKSVRVLGERLTRLRDAPLLERYNGPVLFEGQAAAEIFAQALAPGLIARRIPITDDPRMAGMLEQSQSSLVDKLGARILPRSMGVADDPTLEERGGTRFVTGYAVDEDGVPAERTVLVERGMLKTLLNGRTPVTGVPGSSGNARSSTVLPSTMVIETSQPVTKDELKQELMLLVQDRGAEFGVLVRRISNPTALAPADFLMSMMGAGGGMGGGSVSASAIEAYKVFPDGRQELIRNARLSDIGIASFKEIVAATESDVTYTGGFFPGASAMMSNRFAFGFSGAGSGPGQGEPVSWVVPSVLFEELTIKKPSGQVPKPPAVPHPLRDRDKKPAR